MNETKGLKVGGIPPKTMKKSSKAKFRARVDHYGATLVKFKGKKWYTTNDVYRAGYNQFYVFEIKDGWCRVYSKNNNGYIWHERLRITKVY